MASCMGIGVYKDTTSRLHGYGTVLLVVKSHRPEWGDIIRDFHAWCARDLKRNRLSSGQIIRNNCLKMANIAYIVQACESDFFTSKKLAYGICR